MTIGVNVLCRLAPDTKRCKCAMSMDFATLAGCQRTQKPVYDRPEGQSNVAFAVRGLCKTNSAIYCRARGHSNGLGGRVFDSGLAADPQSRRQAAEEAAKEIQTYYSGLRAAKPLARSSTGLQTAGAASARSNGRSRGLPGEKGSWLAREVSLLREVPDPSQFQSDSQPQGEEFEDAQSYQISQNPEAGGAATEGAYESVAARKQYEGAREVGNGGGVNARTGAGNEKRQEVQVVDRDQGSRTRQAEFDDRESLSPQVSVSSVQERIDEQRRKSYDPNSLGKQKSVTGNRKVWQGSVRAEGAADSRRIASVEADTTGVINRSSGTDSGQPSEVRGDEERGVGLERRSLREGLRHRAFSTPQEAATVRQ
ncbi:hypothetical protein OUZ56_005754 [Daphnia magna]|uniref:Uncharacterized protein n=1 Tax=Daphnia magna TaxID=35525 RepID=A0ABQ9YTN9_9CRUS|nr:hypothetical protein OUZ56_005754 [Daphnia magna]